MKINLSIIFLILVLFSSTGVMRTNSDRNMPLLPTVAYEKHDDDQKTTHRIHSITIGNNEVRYISEIKLIRTEEPINKMYNTPYLINLDDCKIINSKNWKCSSTNGYEMVNGTLRSAYNDLKYKKILYILGRPLINLD